MLSVTQLPALRAAAGMALRESQAEAPTRGK